MAISRRQFLRLGGLTAGTVALTACGVIGQKLAANDLPESLQAPTAVAGNNPSSVDVVWRILNRAGYGPRPGDVERVRQMGLETYLDQQLNPETIEDTATDLLIRGNDLYNREIGDLINQEPIDAARALMLATFSRALTSKRQLYEAAVEFWSDHFNIYLRKQQFVPFFKIVDDRETIRPHALGSFRDLLWASMHSPAMLIYLDNVQNRESAPNENYARELMELHTLGVNSGYTQEDVQEVARVLTGWTIQRRGVHQGQLIFRPEEHDAGTKTVLNQTISGGDGDSELNQLADILVNHPATAQFIATKLVRRFVADEPPASLVTQVAQTFTTTGGEIKPMLRQIFLSPEFAAAPPKLKRPYTFIVSALRSLQAELSPEMRQIGLWLERMGQMLFAWAAPNGYPDVSAAWSANLLPRWNFALTLTTGQVRGVSLPWEDLWRAGTVTTTNEALELVAGLILGRSLDDSARQLLTDYIATDQLGNSEGQQRLKEAVGLLLASPAFQWH